MGTRHGKEQQFAPAFRAHLNADLVTPPDLDTDQFGTFSGEVARRGTALEAARAKARLAMEVTGLPLGLASEASYGPLPGVGWHGHEEILLFCDDEQGVEVLEGFRSAGLPGTGRAVTCVDEVPSALLAGLPGQALIVRPEGVGPILKGITDAAGLRHAIAEVLAGAPGPAVVEPDLRADHNPSRRQVLARLAETLARRLATRCPECSRPGFGRVDVDSGLPCRICGSPTPLARAEIHACAGCGYRLSRPVAAGAADPGECPECNP